MRNLFFILLLFWMPQMTFAQSQVVKVVSTTNDILSAELSVGTTAVRCAVSGIPKSARQSVCFMTFNSSGSCHVGRSNVTTSTGFPIPNVNNGTGNFTSQPLCFNNTAADFHCICTAAGQSVRVIEVN